MRRLLSLVAASAAATSLALLPAPANAANDGCTVTGWTAGEPKPSHGWQYANECVTYGSDHQRQDMDVYYCYVGGNSAKLNDVTKTTCPPRDVSPPSPYPEPRVETRPAVLFIHGGAWTWGQKSDWVRMIRDAPGVTSLLRDRDYVAFAMEYQYAGASDSDTKTTTAYQVQPTDVAKALAWIQTHAADYAIDPGKIAVVGESAGGHLALLHAMQHPLSAVVSYAGPTDLAKLHATPVDLFNVNTYGRATTIETWNGGCKPNGSTDWAAPQGPVDCPKRYSDGSPVKHVSSGDTPTALVHGTQDTDVPIQQHDDMKAALEANRVPVSSYVCNCSHGIHGKYWTWTGPLDLFNPGPEVLTWLYQKLGT